MATCLHSHTVCRPKAGLSVFIYTLTINICRQRACTHTLTRTHTYTNTCWLVLLLTLDIHKKMFLPPFAGTNQ